MSEYPEGVTMSDHIAHDMRMRRFPQKSDIATFLAEREIEALTNVVTGAAQGIAAAKQSEPKVQTEGKSPTPQSGDAP